MKTQIRSERMGYKVVACCLALVVMSGGAAVSGEAEFRVTPLVLEENEQVVRDQLIIIVDVTGSIGSASKFEYEKALVRAFTGSMPDGRYESGIDSFAGVSSREWVNEPLAPFSRDVMTAAASDVKALGSSTPLARNIYSQRSEVTGKMGRGALLIFSDGKVRNTEEVLQACRDMKKAHGGELCIFTVQAGSSERGRRLLQDMAAVNGCGKYYDGASIASAADMDAVVRDILVGVREVPRPVYAAPKPTPPALPWKLNTILFENDSAVIAPMYTTVLDQAAAILRDNPTLHIRLDGHTDSNASAQYNQNLSKRRVDAVRAALLARGCDAARLDVRAHGESRPTSPNDSPKNRHDNRRVELAVIE